MDPGQEALEGRCFRVSSLAKCLSSRMKQGYVVTRGCSSCVSERRMWRERTATSTDSKLLPYTQICSTSGFFLYTASIFSTAMYSPVSR